MASTDRQWGQGRNRGLFVTWVPGVAGEVSPDGMQRLLRKADWDVDGVRDDVRAYAVEHLGDPAAVVVAPTTRVS